jgi:hypothetical protein
MQVCVAVTILMVSIGAAVGVASRPATTNRFGAEATIAVGPAAGISGLRHYADAASLLQVVTGAVAATGSGESVAAIRANTSVVVVPSLRVVLIRARAESQEAALALTNALAERAFEFVRTNLFERSGDGTAGVGDFEDGRRQQWGLVRSAFNSRPLLLRTAHGSARFGVGKLQVRCPARGCGPSRRLFGSFHQGVAYRASAWVRSSSARRGVVLVLGASGADVGASPARTLSASWQRLAATWTPQTDAASAEIALQTRSSGDVSFEVDGVSLADPLAAGADGAVGASKPLASAARDGHRLALAPTARFAAAVPIEARRGVPASAALLGAAGGLAAAVAALGLAFLAQRRNVSEALWSPPAPGATALLEKPRDEVGL